MGSSFLEAKHFFRLKYIFSFLNMKKNYCEWPVEIFNSGKNLFQVFIFLAIFCLLNVLHIIQQAFLTCSFLGSIVVSIPACQAGHRGSIPRRGGIF